jgi:acetyl/propionyl-CoA carboxylase alpha subunit
MLAKLIVWGENRQTAIEKTIYSLDEVLFLGVKTNRDYLKRILEHKDFQAGHTHTHFIPDHKQALEPKKMSDKELAALVAAYSMAGIKMSVKESAAQLYNPWHELAGFRN